MTIILQFIAYAPYIRQTWSGKIKPHPFSWIIWTASCVIVGVIMLTNGGGWATWSHFTVGALCLLVAILAFKRKSHFVAKISRSDWICLILAVAALILFVFAKDPLMATALLILADVLASIPTLAKVRLMPFSETQFMWWLDAFAAVFAIIAIADYNAVTLIQGVGTVIVNFAGAIFIFIYQYGFSYREKAIETVEIAEEDSRENSAFDK